MDAKNHKRQGYGQLIGFHANCGEATSFEGGLEMVDPKIRRRDGVTEGLYHTAAELIAFLVKLKGER